MCIVMYVCMYVCIYLISNWSEFSPGVPAGTNTKGASPQGHFCAPL